MQEQSKPFVSPPKSSLVYNPEQGKLYKYNQNSINVVRFKGLYAAAYEKNSKSNCWQNYLPGSTFPFLFHLPGKESLVSSNDALRRSALYRQKIFEDITALVGKDKIDLLMRFPKRQWFLYCLLHNAGDYAWDIMQTNPAMAYVLSAHGVFHSLKSKNYWRSVRSLLKRRRRDLLQYFDFPGSEATVKLFSKIAPEACSNELFFALRQTLKEQPDALRRMSFFKRHNALSLHILSSDAYPLFEYRALSELAERSGNDAELYDFVKIRDIQRMQSTLEYYGHPPQRIRFCQMRDIDRIHDELVDTMNWCIKIHDYQYPEAPIPDYKSSLLCIENIALASELHREGAEMHHCIYSYHNMVVKGECYVARMLYPERLSIMYQKRPRYHGYESNFELVEARGLCNQMPKRESLAIIDNWLRRVDFAMYHPDQMCLFDLWEGGVSRYSEEKG